MKWLSDHRMAALGFVVSAAYWPGQLQGSFIPRWAVLAVGLPLVSKIDPRAVSEPMRWVLGFLLFVCCLSLMRSPFLAAGVGDLIFILILCAAFLAGAALASLDDLMLGVGTGLALSSLLSVVQYFGIETPFAQGTVSPAGLFFNSEISGEFAGLVAVWAIVRAFNGGSFPAIAIAFAAMIPLVLSHSRIGVIVVAIGLVYAWRPRWRVLVPLMLAVLIGTAYLVFFTKETSSLHRIIIWGATLMAFTPLGTGLGWGTAAYPIEEFAHSDAIQALVELGIGGVALLLIPIAAFHGNRGNNAERALFAAVCVEIAVSFPLHFPASGFLAAIVAGYLVGRGPALRGVAYPGAAADEPRGYGWGNASLANAGRGRPIGGGFPVRSVFPESAALRAPAVGKRRCF